MQTGPSFPEIAKRLKRAKGHLETVIDMVEQGRDCLDLAQQLHAVESAIANAKMAAFDQASSHSRAVMKQRFAFHSSEMAVETLTASTAVTPAAAPRNNHCLQPLIPTSNIAADIHLGAVIPRSPGGLVTSPGAIPPRSPDGWHHSCCEFQVPAVW